MRLTSITLLIIFTLSLTVPWFAAGSQTQWLMLPGWVWYSLLSTLLFGLFTLRFVYIRWQKMDEPSVNNPISKNLPR